MIAQQKINFDLIAEITIGYSHLVKPSQQIQIHSSNDSYKHLLPIWKDIEYRESFAVLLLSRANKILGIRWISTGGTSGTLVDLKLIFQAALKANATAIIAAHNHPSGQLCPSDSDTKLTRKIRDAGTILDITLLDHVILSSEGYYSMADEGII
jgi:DNA repair protein RadC